MRPAQQLAALLAFAGFALPCAGRQAEATALVGVRLVDEPEAPRKTLVLEHGRIRAVLAEGEEIPPTLRRIEAEGLLAVPALIDAFTYTGCPASEAEPDQDVAPATESDVQVEMRAAGRKGIRPAFRAVEVFALEPELEQGYRELGFGALNAAPAGHLLGGSSALVTTGAGALRDRVLEPALFQSATFAAPGDGYPSSLMGRMAQVRQFFLDAQHHAVLLERAARGLNAPRPPFDPDLDAGLAVLAGEQRLLCIAERRGDAERWLALASELGAAPVFAGGGEAWRIAERLAGAGLPVILTLDWGEESPDPSVEDATQDPQADPEPWRYEEPLGVQRERRREWLERRDGALRLNEAGVTLAFGSGAGTPKELLADVRALVEAGLPREVALAGLTSTAAAVLGVADRLGTLAPGQDASFALWTAHPLSEQARVARLFVDGVDFEFDARVSEQAPGPAAGIDAAGSWSIEFDEENARPALLELSMDEAGEVSGRFDTTSPIDESEFSIDVSGRLAGAKLSVAGVRVGANFQIEMLLTGEISGDALVGETVWTYSAGEQRAAFRATREPR